MERRIVCTVGALALAWLSGRGQAADPVPSPTPIRTIAMEPSGHAPVTTLPAPPPCEPAFVPTDAMMGGGGPPGPVAGPGAGPSAGLVGGAACYLIQPFWKTNPAFASLRSVTSGTFPNFTTTSTQIEEDFNWGYNVAPLFWLGFMSDSGLGIRGRWFHFDQNTSLSRGLASTDDGNPGNIDPFLALDSAGPLGVGSVSVTTDDLPRGTQALLGTDSSLKLNVWDLEILQAFGDDRWSLLLGGGCRYAHISQTYNAQVSLPPGPLPFGGPVRISDVQQLRSGHNFNGAGVTASADLRRFLGDSGLALFASGRGSVLFGTSRQRAFYNTISVSQFPDGTATTFRSFDQAANAQDDIIPVLEVEAGAEFGVNMGSSRLFFQAAAVCQNWFGVGNASETNAASAIGPTVTDRNTDLGFFGLKCAAGINY